MTPTSSQTAIKPKAKSRAKEKETTAQTSPSEKQSKDYTALIYFHGMGEQRRYEEVSRLIDELDAYCNKEHKGHLSNIEFGSEMPRTNLPRPVGYVGATHFLKDEKGQGRKEFRFYEAYYANLSAGGMPVWSVLSWLLSLAWMPLHVLRTRWRGRMRLRRATLMGLLERPFYKRQPNWESDRERLLETYEKFEGLDARRAYKAGSFMQFLKFLDERFPRHSDPGRRLRKLANWWGAYFVWVQVEIILLILTVLLGLYQLIGHGIPFVAQLIVNASPFWFWIGLGLSAFVIVKLLQGAKIFLGDFLSDVYFWTTYQETAAKNKTRREILDYCADFISHVVCDDACQRVVLVGHSLGTTVIHDTMLELAFRNRSKDPDSKGEKPLPLYKIEHIFTMASPVDKIHYLFESSTTTSHRFNRVLETLRGDLGNFPFSRSGQPLIHWINFWNRADVVSSPLYTPAGKFSILQVDNYEIFLGAFPEPVDAHTNYVRCPTVIETIHDVLFKHCHSFVQLFDDAKGNERPDFQAAFIGHQGKRNIGNTIWQWIAVLIPWSILLWRLLAGYGF